MTAVKIYFIDTFLIRMPGKISKRLLEIIDALPLVDGMRILEIGCGPGAAAREIAARLRHGYVLGIDRSAKAIGQAISGSKDEIATGKLEFRQSPIGEFELSPGEEPYDLALAIRVGALDGRHPELQQRAFERLAAVLKKNGKLYMDGGRPLKVISVTA